MRAALLIGAYVVGAFLTFGYVWNENFEPYIKIECGDKPDILTNPNGNAAWYACEHKRIKADYNPRSDRLIVGYPAFLAGAGWPIYWAGRIAIEVTK